MAPAEAEMRIFGESATGYVAEGPGDTINVALFGEEQFDVMVTATIT